jgi:hypothetical protein
MAGKIIAAVEVSVDGFVAGPDDDVPGQALRQGGDELFTWFEDYQVTGERTSMATT